MKKGLAMVLAGAMVVASLTACGSSKKETTAETKAAETTTETTAETKEAAADGKTYKIGVLQLVEHAALDASNEGFVAALDDAGISYTIDQQNAQGDQTACQTIAEKLVNDGCSMTYIGSLYGVSSTTVKNWLRNYNLVAKTSFEYKRSNK